MRAALIAAAVLMVATPALAQFGGNGAAEARQREAAERAAKAKQIDRDYKAASQLVPLPDQKPDPWGGVRDTPATPKTPKK